MQALIGQDNRHLVTEALFNESLAYALIVLSDWTWLQNMNPDIQALASLQVNGPLVGVIVTAKPPPGDLNIIAWGPGKLGGPVHIHVGVRYLRP